MASATPDPAGRQDKAVRLTSDLKRYDSNSLKSFGWWLLGLRWPLCLTRTLEKSRAENLWLQNQLRAAATESARVRNEILKVLRP